MRDAGSPVRHIDHAAASAYAGRKGRPSRRAYWSCHRCHAELADHPAVPVPAGEFDRPHVLCGVCRTELSVTAYLALEATADPACPACGAPFNPGCAAHAPLYFDVPASGSPAGDVDPATRP